MEPIEDFKFKSSSFQINTKIVNCDANYKYIIVANDSNIIEGYSIENFIKLFSYPIFSRTIHIQFHPIYYNIFSVTVRNSISHLFNIDIKTNKLEEKVKYISSSKDTIIKTMFSPYLDGKYLATLFDSNIKIWNITEYNSNYVISIDLNISNINNCPIKWSESGQYLIYQKNHCKIELFSLLTNAIDFHLIYKAKDFYFIEDMNQIITLNNKEIIFWDIDTSAQLYKLDYLFYFKQTLIDYNNSYIYIMDDDIISIFDFENKIKILEYELKNYSEFFLLKDINKGQDVFTKLLLNDFDQKEFKIIEISSQKYTSNNNYNIIEAPENYWEKSIDKINNNYEFLSYKYNQIESDEIHKKKYLAISEVSIELDELIQNKTLEEKRKIVVNYNKNFIEDNDIYKTYINYVKNLIKDNTNDKLLLNYLRFIKKNDTELANQFGNSYENFADEINQYQSLFEKSLLLKEFGFIKKSSEKEKLIELCNEILLLNKNDRVLLNKFLLNKKPELENFLYNQPISFNNNKELFYCKNKIVILNSLEKIIKGEKFEIIDYMKYCIKEVLNRNFLNRDYIINNNIYNSIITILIASPEREIITNYNLNLIDNQDIDATEKELLSLGFQYDKGLEIYKKDNLSIKKAEINLFNLKNIKLYLNTNEKMIFQDYELYKFEYLRDYYSKKFDEDKLRHFIGKILVSNVFKEAFSFFYGNNIKYPFMDKDNKMSEKKSKEFLDTHLKFIPLKNETTNAVTEKFSMETYILLNHQLILSNLNDSEKILTDDEILIHKALINGAIVAINDHEINHNFHNYFYCSKNGNEVLKTPRKIEMDERKGGNNMERILFGRILNDLTLKQSLYILNEKNYEKSLNVFRKEFFELKEENCKCNGIFKEYMSMKFNIKELSDYMVINFKSNKYKIHSSYISIKLKNDVLGFPNFD